MNTRHTNRTGPTGVGREIQNCTEQKGEEGPIEEESETATEFACISNPRGREGAKSAAGRQPGESSC